MRYNSGSIALGSFLLAIVWLLRSLLEYADKKIKETLDSESPFVNMAHQCMKCAMDCFHRFLKYLNENAYVQVGLTGDSFCHSAITAYVLALKNSSSFFITHGIGTLINVLGKATISIGNVVIGYTLL